MNMIIFEYRDAEKKFFETNEFRDYNITFFKEPLNEDFVDTLSEDLLGNTNIISVFIESDVSKKVIDKFKNLRIISTRSTGYDHISVKSCQYKNIALVNVTNYGETSVAQFTFGLIIALVRNLPHADRVMKKFQPKPETFIGRDLSKLTIGIIGTGAIGAAVCRTAYSFGMRIFGYDTNPKQELVDKFGIEYLSFDEVIRQSDIITLHLPYTCDNYRMFNKDVFNNMKNEAYFINTARGELVDVEALCKSIESKKLSGAALDVLTCENVCFGCEIFPDISKNLSLDCLNEAFYVNRLKKYDNVIITPHIAYETQDAIDFILEKTMENIKRTINGDKLCRVV